MAAKRSDCVLVVDEADHLSGIFTAKDLAYRIVASNLDSRALSVSDIMTRNPLCVTADTSAQDALNLMVSRGFRHLPVCNEEGDIFGLLDITKCLYEALNKMERAYGSSRKLYDALEGVEREWANSPVQFVQYLEALRDRMSCPDLTTVLVDQAPPVQVPVKASVREVARLMKEHHTTAVLVMDHRELAGIFTSKDIVLRVIAAGLMPETCSVVRVMTPHPDVASTSTSILDALKKMHDGHYLNLPVVDEDKSIVGLVDVLRLTYATLEQINSIEGHDQEGASKFWNSIAVDDPHETESALSDSLSQGVPSSMLHHQGSPMGTPNPDHIGPLHHSQSPVYTGVAHGESTPDGSASMLNDDTDTRSSVSTQPPATFAFKFYFNNKTYRIRHDYSSYTSLRDIVCQKILGEHASLLETRNASDTSWLSISYLDDEGDHVLMLSDNDLVDSVQLARKLGQDRVRLFVYDELAPKPETSGPRLTETPNRMLSPVHPTDKESEPSEIPDMDRRRRNRSIALRRSSRPSRREFSEEEESKLLLPAAIAFLGVVILGVFTISKMTGSRHHY
ncbi:uncharacterized protein BYT42DRAFT_489814 [Radiomyces spectabilis]|uniref:uncharacterized protein n=1 Tax=Radiomyces spectabilis TaxID=64574 RepID=UPI00221F836C|nr:uncharacterized protein BYT42DRAFT_489814 [Radiomyces spectabilis]KAI8391405.1 hypothetical protein BYT42DRAFT_489814 [Radiomyces spectabilis]